MRFGGHSDPSRDRPYWQVPHGHPNWIPLPNRPRRSPPRQRTTHHESCHMSYDRDYECSEYHTRSRDRYKEHYSNGSYRCDYYGAEPSPPPRPRATTRRRVAPSYAATFHDPNVMEEVACILHRPVQTRVRAGSEPGLNKNHAHLFGRDPGQAGDLGRQGCPSLPGHPDPGSPSGPGH